MKFDTNCMPTSISLSLSHAHFKSDKKQNNTILLGVRGLQFLQQLTPLIGIEFNTHYWSHAAVWHPCNPIIDEVLEKKVSHAH